MGESNPAVSIFQITLLLAMYGASLNLAPVEFAGATGIYIASLFVAASDRQLCVLPPEAFASSTVLLGLGARRHDVDHRHVTKVGIIGIVEPVLSDESLEIVDVRLPALRVVEQRFREDDSRDAQLSPPQVGALQAKVAISALRVQVEGVSVGGLRCGVEGRDAIVPKL